MMGVPPLKLTPQAWAAQSDASKFETLREFAISASEAQKEALAALNSLQRRLARLEAMNQGKG